MKKILFIPILFVVSSVYGWDIKLENGEATCIQCETYQVYNSSTSEYETVVVSSEPLTTINQLKSEGFKKSSRTEWINEINKRINETYTEKRAREYPSVGDQLDAIWKILNDQEDEQSDAIKSKIIEVKTKYPKP